MTVSWIGLELLLSHLTRPLLLSSGDWAHRWLTSQMTNFTDDHAKFMTVNQIIEKQLISTLVWVNLPSYDIFHKLSSLSSWSQAIPEQLCSEPATWGDVSLSICFLVPGHLKLSVTIDHNTLTVNGKCTALFSLLYICVNSCVLPIVNSLNIQGNWCYIVYRQSLQTCSFVSLWLWYSCNGPCFKKHLMCDLWIS